MEQKKDYSLLRPFDLEAAKAGEAICFKGVESSTSVTYVAGPDKAENIICDVGGYFKEYFHTALWMAPLAWVEGKPVYKGDVLYRPTLGPQKYVAERIERDDDGDVFLRYANGGGSSWLEGPEDMGLDVTWTPPKVKREGYIIILEGMGDNCHETMEEAEKVKEIYAKDYPYSIVVKAELEEPVGQEGGAA